MSRSSSIIDGITPEISRILTEAGAHPASIASAKSLGRASSWALAAVNLAKASQQLPTVSALEQENTELRKLLKSVL